MANVAKLKKRALDFEQKKQFDKALEIYAQILDGLDEHVDEADMALYNRVGDLMLRRGNISAAVDHYEKAVDLYTEGGFFNNAIALCNKVLRNAPGRASVYYKLGKISAQKGFINDAKQNFLEFADRMQQAGDFEEAFRALKEFADLCPDQDDIRLMLADQLVQKERKGEAVEQLQRLHDKLKAEGRETEARATVDRMKAIDPDVEPRVGSFMPTPRSSDLIFLDVNYDGPSTDDRRAAPRPEDHSASPISSGTPPSVLPLIDDEPEIEPYPTPMSVDLPLLDTEDIEPEWSPPELAESDQVASEPTLAEHATSDDAPAGDAALEAIVLDAGADDGHSPDAAPQVDGLIRGFDDSLLADTARDDVDAAADRPLLEPGTGTLDGMQVNQLLMEDSDLAMTSDVAESSVFGGGTGGDLPMLDIPLEEDGSPVGTDLTFIQFEDEPQDDERSDGEDRGAVRGDAMGDAMVVLDAGVEATAAPAPVASDAAPDDAVENVAAAPSDAVPDVDDGAAAEADAPAGSELRDTPPAAWQGLGESESESDAASSADPEVESRADGEAGGNPEPEAEADAPPVAEEVSEPEPELAPADRLRVAIAEQPQDWQLRRKLAEALFEEGDRAGGLRELEAVMLGLEEARDLSGASAMVDEIIRVEPNSIRHHQKRVEYAVRSNDKARLVDSYVDLAEALFRVGELDKSRIVYGRVLELAPADERVRSALRTIGGDRTTRDGDAADACAAGVRTPTFTPTRSVPAPAPAPASAHREPWRRPTPTPSAMRAVPRESTNEAFVNLSDWLQEEAAPKSTRMVVDVREPAHNEQVDFAEMLAMFKKGVAANVDEADHESHYDLGVAYKEMGLLDEAISEFQKALRGADDRVRTYEALGQCFVEKEQYQIASAILTRALNDKQSTDDMLVGVLYLLGLASEMLQRWQDAQRYYERVFAIDIDFRDVNERLVAMSRRAQ